MTDGIQELPTRDELKARAAKVYNKMLNDLCVGLGHKPIWDDPEAKPVDTGKMKE